MQSYFDTALTKKQVKEWGLVLEAMNIPYLVRKEDELYYLVVEDKNMQSAREQLDLYERENSKTGLNTEALPVEPFEDKNIPLIFPLVLYIFHLTLVFSGMHREWIEKGGAIVYKIKSGEWYRLVTALTLHADFLHIISNLAFGLILMTYIVRALGSGFGWFLVLLSGISGNFINIFFQSLSHRAVGSSTAIFGAIGILAGMNMLSKLKTNKRKVWLVLAAAIAVVGLLGTSENSDIFAHFFGFVSGLALSFLTRIKSLQNNRMQFIILGLSAVLILLCWTAALHF